MENYAFQTDWDEVKRNLSYRLREIRIELYGEHGGPILAHELDVPYRTWVQYEAGVSMPAQVLLRFLEVTKTSTHWLLTGDGPKFRPKGRGD